MQWPNQVKFTDGLELCQFKGNDFEVSLNGVSTKELKKAIDSLKASYGEQKSWWWDSPFSMKSQSDEFKNYLQTIYLANIERTSTFSSFDEFVEPWIAQTHDIYFPKNMDRGLKSYYE